MVELNPEHGRQRLLMLLDLDKHPRARRQDVARALVNLARGFARAESIPAMEVCWLSADPRSSAVWQSQGFTPYLSRGRSPVAPC